MGGPRPSYSSLERQCLARGHGFDLMILFVTDSTSDGRRPVRLTRLIRLDSTRLEPTRLDWAGLVRSARPLGLCRPSSADPACCLLRHRNQPPRDVTRLQTRCFGPDTSFIAAAAVRPLSAVRHPPSAVRRPPSAVRRPPSAARRPPPAARSPPPAVRRPPSAVRRPAASYPVPSRAARSGTRWFLPLPGAWKCRVYRPPVFLPSGR